MAAMAPVVAWRALSWRMVRSEADELMQVKAGEPGSVGGIVAAWAGSITLHVGVIWAMLWAAPPPTPLPERPSVLQVAVIHSVSASPPEIQSSDTTGSAVSRADRTPPVRMTALTPPVLRSRTREIRTVPAAALEERPAARVRKQSVLPSHEPRRSHVATRRVQSVEPEAAIRHRPAGAASRARPALREREGISHRNVMAEAVRVEPPASGTAVVQRASATDRRESRPVPAADRQPARSGRESSIGIDTVSRIERRGSVAPTLSRLPKDESVVTVPSPTLITVRNSPRVASHHPTAIRRGAPSRVVQVDTDPGTIDLHVLEQTPSRRQLAHPAEQGPKRRVKDGLPGTRRVKMVQQLSTRGSIDSQRDYGWLAQAMHRRIAQLKRYPHVARLNQWEGRVVLRAVIREDGELAALSVRASSGHHELDVEAMKLVRQVCPVPLAQPLGRREITMHIPITYTLDR